VAVDFTTTALLASIRRHAMIPGPSTGTNTDTLDDTDLLALATEELWSYVVPLLVSVNEEFFVTSTTVSVSSTVTTVQIPGDAVSEGLRDVQILDGSVYRSLARIEPEREGDLSASSGTPTGYRLEGNTVVLIPAPSSSATIKLKYFRRPGKLVRVTDAGTVNQVDVTPSISLWSTPSWVDTATHPVVFVPGAAPFYDPTIALIGVRASYTIGDSLGGGYEWGATGTGSATFSTLIEALNLAAVSDTGLYLCRDGESCVPEVPPEFHALLALRTAQVALESLGDQRSEMLEKRCERMKAGLLQTIVPRARGKGRTIINPYAPGTRSPRWRRFR
jgi:hypothetical protein